MRLPESLLQEINATDARKHGRRPPYVSRKEMRKQQRLDRKKGKEQFYGAKKRTAREEHTESLQRKRTRQEGYQPDNRPLTTSTPSKIPEKKTPNSGDSNNIIRPVQVPKAKSRVEEEEEAYIAYLESRLGYSSLSKKNRRSEDDDGLGDLLDFTDSVIVGKSTRASEIRDRDDISDEGSEEYYSSEEDEEDATAIDGTGQEDGSENNDEEWSGIDNSIHVRLAGSVILAQPNAQPSTEVTAEVIRYVPPQLRNHDPRQLPNQNPEPDIKLTKQLKGLLNRMSEQNIATILDGIEEMYRTYRRHDVTSTLTKLIINGITSHSSLLDSFVALHAAFVSSLYRVNGVEFAAFFVQTVISDYDQHYAAVRAQDIDTHAGDLGKECSNLIVLLSELYNFQVVAAILIYDVIRSLLHDELAEFSVELLLKLLRNSGQRLRQDDPSALKDIITIVQDKASVKEGNLSSRTRFMLETLISLKNNKQRNATQHQGSGILERMEKFLAGLGKKRHLHAHDALRVSLDDLRNAESKGKWWLVGAPWAGNPLVDKQMDIHTTDNSAQENVGEELLKLAKKQGMNTDIRRSIFLVIMSSDDYVDACERLSQLKLSEVQQREIVRVLLHCCGNERTYNPYYSLVCQHLCQTSRAYQITLQYCLWDFLRDLGEAKVGGAEIMKNVQEDDHRFSLKSISKVRLRHLARAYGWWIAKDSISIIVLKPVDFSALKPQGKEFIQELLIDIFLSSQTALPLMSSGTRNLPTTRNRAAVEEIFIKATRVEELAMGLVYIMTDIFRDFSSQDEELTKLVRWAIGVAKVTLRTELDTVSLPITSRPFETLH